METIGMTQFVQRVEMDSATLVLQIVKTLQWKQSHYLNGPELITLKSICGQRIGACWARQLLPLLSIVEKRRSHSFTSSELDGIEAALINFEGRGLEKSLVPAMIGSGLYEAYRNRIKRRSERDCIPRVQVFSLGVIDLAKSVEDLAPVFWLHPQEDLDDRAKVFKSANGVGFVLGAEFLEGTHVDYLGQISDVLVIDWTDLQASFEVILERRALFSQILVAGNGEDVARNRLIRDLQAK
jgi:hypothetical protein